MTGRQRILKTAMCWAMLAMFFVSIVAPASAFAFEEVAGQKVTQESNKEIAEVPEKADKVHAEASFVDLCKGAINGDRLSIDELIQSKVIPTLILLAALVLTFSVASSIGRYVGGMVSKKVDLTLGKFLTKAIRNLLMVVVAIGVLGYYGIDVTAYAAILAAVGFAVGMALQGTLGNFASGVMLLVFRPFKVDDYIVVADTAGTVEEIDLFTTRINTPDNRHIIIPNSEIFGSKLENYTRNQLRRVDVNVGAAYAADLDQTRAALERAIAKSGGVDEPSGCVCLKELGASSVDWQLRLWCDVADYWAVRERLIASAKIEMDRAGIGIPYPQLDVHVGGKLLAKSA